MKTLDRIQSKAKKAVLLALNDTGQALLQMATGTGKTNTAKDVLDSLIALKPDARVLWLNHSNELIEQTTERILSFNPDMDIGIFDGEVKDVNAQVIIASVQTIARKNNLDKFNPKDFDFIFVDEAHHTPAQTWRGILGHFKGTKNFGFTATPYRPDGQSLEEYFGQPVFELSFTKAQRLGVLSKDISYVILTNSVLAPIITKAGEYSPKSLERLHTTNDRNETIIKAYKKYGRGQMTKAGLRFKSICYCINAAHAKRMSEMFTKAGIPSTFIVGDTKHMVPAERKAAYDTFRNTFDIEVMCVVNIFNEAVDIPNVACLLMARPTRSNIVYSQQVGRGARIIPTLKEKFVILDFVDNTRREYQGYIMSNLLKKGVSHDRVICEYLHEKDPVLIRQRVKDVMRGVEEFENRFRRSWTLEECKASSARFSSKISWNKNDRRAYEAAYVNGWLKECCQHMKLRQSWTKETCLEDAKKYSDCRDWRKKSLSSYNAASKRGWLREIYTHVPMSRKVSHKFTKDQCMSSARGYKNAKAWQNGANSVYNAASKKGWLKECCQHMKGLRKPNGYWTKERCKSDAKRFKTRSGWERKSKSASSIARKNGWTEECCKHMPRRAP
jgi:superfamily II DNA or RNA helicase